VLTDNSEFFVSPLEHLSKKFENLKEDEKLQSIIPQILTDELEEYLKKLPELIEAFKGPDPNKIPRFDMLRDILTIALNCYLSDMEKSENKIKRTLTTDLPLSYQYSKKKEKIIELMKELEIPRQTPSKNHRILSKKSENS